MPIQATLTIFSSKKIKLNKRLRPPEKISKRNRRTCSALSSDSGARPPNPDRSAPRQKDGAPVCSNGSGSRGRAPGLPAFSEAAFSLQRQGRAQDRPFGGGL